MNVTPRRLSAGLAAAALAVVGLGYAPAHAGGPFDPAAPFDLSAASFDVTPTAPLAISPDETTAFIAGYNAEENSVVRAIDLTTGMVESLGVEGSIYGLTATATGAYFASSGVIWSWDGNSENSAVHLASPESVYASAFTVENGNPVAVGADEDGDTWVWQPQSDGSPSGVSHLTYVPSDVAVTDLAFVAGQSQPIVIGDDNESGDGGMWAPHASVIYDTYSPADILATTDHQVLVSGGAANSVHAYTFDAEGVLTQTIDAEVGNTARQMALGLTPGTVYLAAYGSLSELEVSKFPAYAADTAFPKTQWLGDDVSISSFVASALTAKLWMVDQERDTLSTITPPVTGAPSARATSGDPHSITVAWDATDSETGAQSHTITATPRDAPEAVKPATFTVKDWADCTTAASRTTCVVGYSPVIAAATVYEVTVAAADELFTGPAVEAGTLTTAPPYVPRPKAFRISGNARVGGTLSIAPSVGVWAPGTKVTYTWAADGSPFATGTSVVLKAPQQGRYIGVAATATLSGFTSNMAYAASLNTPVGAAVLPPVKVTKAPKVTGKTKVGKKLTVTKPKTVAGATTRYQWLRNGVAIKGATKATYKPTKKDKKKVLSVRVTVTKAGTSPYVKVIRVGKVT